LNPIGSGLEFFGGQLSKIRASEFEKTAKIFKKSEKLVFQPQLREF
jgi:hypothetical protein